MKKILFLIMFAFTSISYSQKINENVSIKIVGKTVTITTIKDKTTVSYWLYNNDKPDDILSKATLTNVGRTTSASDYPAGNYSLKLTKNGKTYITKFIIK